MAAFTIGADPEVMLLNIFQKPASAINIIPGHKRNPHKFKFGTMHPDNVMAEFNTAVASCKQTFSNIVSEGLQAIEQAAKAQFCTVSKASHAEFDEMELNHPDAGTAGCDPDYNAYTKSVNNPPDFLATPSRCAGGHIHIGTSLTDEQALTVIQCLDLFITIPMLKVDDPQRRQLYGKAGAFRRKEYGVEYRTPSNHWIFTERSRQWVYDQVDYVLEHYATIELDPRIPEAINNHDIVVAEQLMQQYNITQYPEN